MYVYNILAGKHKGKGPLGRPRLIWVDNIRIYIAEISCEVVS
jgi:hypothetical protein